MTAAAVRSRDRATGVPALVVARSVVGAAVGAALLGLLLVSAAVLLAWATDGRSGSDSAEASRAGGLAWLLAHRVPLAVPGGRLALAPLGLTAVVALLCARAGAHVARHTPAGTPGRTVLRGAVVGVPYGVVAALLTGLLRNTTVRPAPVSALLSTGLVAGAAAAAGAARAVGRPRAPARVEAVVAGTIAAVCVLAATGAAGMAVSLAWHGGRTGDLAGVLAPGAAGLLALLLLCTAYAPNAVVWAAAYGLGTGFAVGTGSVVAPTGIQLGPVPALPLLAALPANGPAPLPSLLFLLGPVAAGVVAGLVVVRRSPGLSTGRAAAWGLATGPLAGLVVGLGCWLAGGPAGPGRLATAGPPPLLAGLAATEWVGFVAAVVAALAARRAARR